MKKEYNYSIHRKHDSYQIVKCHIDMNDIGVWVEKEDEITRIFIPYSNIEMIVEYPTKENKC